MRLRSLSTMTVPTAGNSLDFGRAMTTLLPKHGGACSFRQRGPTPWKGRTQDSWSSSPPPTGAPAPRRRRTLSPDSVAHDRADPVIERACRVSTPLPSLHLRNDFHTSSLGVPGGGIPRDSTKFYATSAQRVNRRCDEAPSLRPVDRERRHFFERLVIHDKFARSSHGDRRSE